jgi:radical SAM superfamily enzyme YgiQ (UPF0313 family)
MRVLFVSAGTEKINLPTYPLGLASVAQATLAAGHELECLDLLAAGEPLEVLRRSVGAFKPEIIGISVRNIDDQNMLKPKFLLEQAREAVTWCSDLSEASVVVGGAGYSLFPESALEYLGADMGIQGEGEQAFPLLLDHLAESRPLSGLPGLYLRGRGLQGERGFALDLDSLPLPEPGLFPTAAYEGEDFWVPVQTRRGCPMRCSYCSTEIIEGSLIRRRSPQKLVQWLARWVEAGFRRFQFVDNTFNLPPSYAETLCATLAEAPQGIAWRCILYPGNLEERLVRAMGRAGCEEVSLGFESGCDEILRGMNKRFRKQQVRQAARMLSDQGISTMGFLMLGAPGETRHSVEESLDFVSDLNLRAVKITLGIRIYPHTRVARIALEEGLISPDDNLLFPRFYMARGLEDWLRQTIVERIREHRNWIM